MVRGEPNNAINQQQPTTYGTTSFNTGDDALTGASSRRRNVVRWGVTALTIGAGLALLGYGSSTPSAASLSVTTESTSLASAPTPTVGQATDSKPIQCWQSSYLNNETKMMEPIKDLAWTTKASSSSSSSFIRVDGTKKYQEIFGFGGAFTEAAALQFEKLSSKKQEEILTLYFDKEHGSAYEFGRVPMGSCDFTTESYNFANETDDFELAHFDDNVTQDTKLIIPFIHRAMEKNANLKLFLAPWSPPAWMKQGDDKYNPSMLGSVLPNGLRLDVRKPWANYFSRFISAYKKHGLNFWGLSPQNEPEFAAPWEACGYNASFEADFVGEFLGPVMKRDHPEVKIMVYDHNRASVLDWAETVFNHPTAKQYVDGIAVHWYDNERYMDGVEFHERVNDTHYVDESRFIMATESCNCPGVATGDEAWFRAQRYGHDILTNFNNWVVGWVDWNLLLDHKGGPNHLGNNCDAPIIIDESEQDYFIQPMFYFIQHFSKFVPPGSRRIDTQVAARFEKPGDAQLFVRYPAAIHACDQSARQMIHVTEDSKLQVTGTNFCIDLVRPQWVGRQVELVDCRYTSQKWTFVNGTIRMAGHCLQLHRGSPLSGARVTVGHCVDDADADYQKWQFGHGQMQSLASPATCVTAGYAFVQSVSFVTPENKKVVVVLNENTEDATFELQYGDAAVETTIPRGAIRTYTWE